MTSCVTRIAALREAGPADNAGLVDLAASCPMTGDIGLCVMRSPDFFALNRLEGDRWRVGVVDAANGGIAGCIAAAERSVYIHGRPVRAGYVGDLKVHPAHRSGETADALTMYARDTLEEWLGAQGPTLLTILAGNRAMERRLAGPRGLPHLDRFATIHSYSILLAPRPSSRSGLQVRSASAADAEEMAALWQRVAPQRQFASVHDAHSLARWIETAPSLDWRRYLLARDRTGRLAGFLALWDQSAFKQLRVTGYTRRMDAVRRGFNALTPLIGAQRLPDPGLPMRHATVVHLCVPAEAPQVLRALLDHASRELRRDGYSFFNLGLDAADPLVRSLRGIPALKTRISACVTTPSGRYSGAPLDDRPLHHEIALV